MNAPRPFAIDFRRLPHSAGAGAALLLAGAFAASACAAWYANIDGEFERAEAQTTEMKRMMRRAPGRVDESRSDAREMQQEVRAANAVIQQMAIPWDRLFSEIESTVDAEVGLLSIQPDVGNRLVRISGEARNFNAMLAYSRRLENTDLLHNVVLLGHEIKTQDPQRPVLFAMSVGWSEQP